VAPTFSFELNKEVLDPTGTKNKQKRKKERKKGWGWVVTK